MKLVCSETWPMKSENVQRMEKLMIDVCGINLKNRIEYLVRNGMSG